MTDPAAQHDAAAGDRPQGDVPVTLGDRTRGGSPAANQGKTEPFPPTTGHRSPTGNSSTGNSPAGSSGPARAGEPVAGIPLERLGVGVTDPHAPSHPAAAARPFTAAPSGPSPQGYGAAQRAAGSQGAPEGPL